MPVNDDSLKFVQRTAAGPSFHFVGRRQTYRTPVLVFLDVIPDELLSKPCGLPGCKLSILEKQPMADRKPGATLITRHSRHLNYIGYALVATAYPLGHSTRPLLLRFA